MRIRIGFLFLFLFLIVYWLVSWISSLPKTSAEYSDETKQVISAAGENIFWGKGRCHVCHRIGERGYALRGPNLGEGKDGAIIGIRADQRAKKAGLKSGADYLVQSMIVPAAFIVPNYKNEMPKIYEPPIALLSAEIKAVVLYLNSLGSSPEIGAIQIPALSSSDHKSNASSQMKIVGDVESGRSLFFNTESGAGCVSCHVGINRNGVAEGSTLGPDLTAIAAYRTPEHIYSKIVKPDSNIVSGYEEVLLKTSDDRFLVGMITGETTDEIFLTEKTSNKIVVRKDRIATRIVQHTSTMPENYHDLLTEEQILDLLAYLAGLAGKEELN